MIVRIEDPADPRVAPYHQVRERDLVGREGLFIAEGQVVLEKAVAAGRHPLVSVLLAEKRVEALAPLLLGLPADVPVYAAGQAVLDAIAGFHLHRGILALGRRADVDAGALLAGLPDKALVVALVGIANHDNMGGIFRNAAAFGADAVLLDPTCCDPLYRKAIRVSVGAALTMPFAEAEDPLALLAEAGFEVVALSPRGEVEIGDLRPAGGRTALLLGAEGPGLPDAMMARATSVRIDMAGGFDSLNVATTSGIVLHHLRSAR
ncbi:MAG: methyltransferase [Caulobacteraceae bacterium]|nr:methyltransferase [Caulobacteraceae bacterium]